MKNKSFLFTLIELSSLLVYYLIYNLLYSEFNGKQFFEGFLIFNLIVIFGYFSILFLIKKYKNIKYSSKKEYVKMNLNSEISLQSIFYGNNTTINIQGVEMSDSLLYLSVSDSTIDYVSEIPFLIVSKLPIAKKRYHYQENKNRKLQSYTGMSQKEKLEFLSWVAEGFVGEIYNKDYIYIYVEGLRYRFFEQKLDQESCLLRVVHLYKLYKEEDRKIKSYLEETLLYFMVQIDYFSNLKELTNFIKSDLNLFKHDSLRYKLILEYIIFNSYPVDWFYLIFLYSIVYKDLDKNINSKNRKFLLELFKDEFSEELNVSSVRSESIEFKNYTIEKFNYIMDVDFEEKLNKFLEKTISDLKVFLLATKNKSFEESFHFLPDKFKKKYENPIFTLILRNIKNKNGVYSIGDILDNNPYFLKTEDKLIAKETKFLNQIIVDGQWSIEPDYRISNKNYKKKQKVFLYKKVSKEIENPVQEIKNQVVIDTIYSLISGSINSNKKKKILNFMENKIIKEANQLERVKRRLYLLEKGITPQLKNLSKVKFSKENIKDLKVFFNENEDFVFSLNKKSKFLELIS
jgi:hypothetical protein